MTRCPRCNLLRYTLSLQTSESYRQVRNLGEPCRCPGSQPEARDAFAVLEAGVRNAD